MAKINDIFGKDLTVVNVGLAGMAKSISDQGVKVVDLDWTPPKDGIPRLRATKSGVGMDAANQEVVSRIKRGQAFLVGMGIAREVIPGMHDHMILHAGPPIEWGRMCGPTCGAVMGALIYEGLAQDENEAVKLVESGAIEFSPCHHHHAVGPMAGVVSPNMPVWILENKAFGNRAYCTLNEAWAKCCAMEAWVPKSTPV